MLSNRKTGSPSRIAIRLSKIAAPRPVRVWRRWLVVEIGFLFAVITLFNLFPQLIGIDRSPDAVSQPMPLSAPGFIETLPWLNLWWGLALSLNIVILFFYVRPSLVKFARLAINLFGLILLLHLLITGPVIGFNPAWLSDQSANVETLANLEAVVAPVLSLLTAAAISIAVLALSYTSLLKLRHLFLLSRKNFSSDSTI